MSKQKYLKKIQCQGDFCMFLNEHENEDNDIDYDLLVNDK